jgi:hypothetical protein
MATKYRSKEIIDIVESWMKWAERTGPASPEFWYLYDLACGRALPPAPARAFVAKMDASKPKVKIVLDWLCKVE